MSNVKTAGDTKPANEIARMSGTNPMNTEKSAVDQRTLDREKPVSTKQTSNSTKQTSNSTNQKESHIPQPLYHVSSSSHIRSHTLTSHIMRDVIIALLPATAFGIYRFGLPALWIVIATVISCVATEYVYQKCMKKPLTILDYSAAVTGLILALNMPPEIPVWIPMLGGVFAILVVKQLYGGIGFNWMNPALAARCFLLISFAGEMTDFTSKSFGYDAVSGPTPLAAMREIRNFGEAAGGIRYTLTDLFFGNIPGTIGEISVIALLIGVAYMLVRRIISLRIPLAYLLTFTVLMAVFGSFDPMFLGYQLLGGGLIFGAFFMATDYTTSPITPRGQIYFGMFIGFLTAIFRLFGGSAEGVSYAIIIGNIVAPLMEKYTIPVAFGKERK